MLQKLYSRMNCLTLNSDSNVRKKYEAEVSLAVIKICSKQLPQLKTVKKFYVKVSEVQWP